MSSTGIKELEDKVTLAFVALGVTFSQALVELCEPEDEVIEMVRQRTEAMQHHLEAISPSAAAMLGIFARALHDERFFPGHAA
jgi:hypothetical protein